MRQFVPMTDEMLSQLASLPGPLVPYRCGVPCRHALSEVTPTISTPSSARDLEHVADLHAELVGNAGI